MDNCRNSKNKGALLEEVIDEQAKAEANDWYCSSLKEHNETGHGCVGCEEMFKLGAKFFKEHLWRDASEELPTSYGEPVLCICRNKNKPDGIWLMDLIHWEGSWEGRENYEKVLYWAYANDILPDYHFGM